MFVGDGGVGAEEDGACGGGDFPVVGGVLWLGCQKGGGGERGGVRSDGEESYGTPDQGDQVGVVGVDGDETEGHVDCELEAIVVVPGAIDLGEGAGLEGLVGLLAVDEESGVRAGPGGDAEGDGEAFGAVGLEVKLGVSDVGVLGVLGEGDVGASLLPTDARGHVEIDVEGVGRVEVGADAVVGGELGEGAGAAGPLVVVGEFVGVVIVVVGVVEADAVGTDGEGAEDGVVEDGFHAVAVSAVAGDAKETAGDLEVAVGAAGSFEAGVGAVERLGELIGAGGAEGFVGTPAAGGEALLANEAEAVLGGAEMLVAAVGEIGLHGGGERVEVAVGVLAGEDVLIFGERVEVSVVFKEAGGELAETRAGAALVGEIEVFGESVGLVPAEGNVGHGAGLHLVPVEGFGREEGEDDVGGFVEDVESDGVGGELVGVDEAAGDLVGGVGGETVAFVKLW